MLTTLLPSSRLVAPEQFANAPLPMVVTPLPMVMEVAPEHPENAPLPISVTLSGITMITIFIQR